MNTSDDSKNKFNPLAVIGGPIGWLDEVGFETISRPFTQAASDIKEALTDLAENSTNGVLSANGSIEFQKAQEEKDKKREETDRKKLFFQALKEDQQRAKEAREKVLLEDEISDMVTNLPTEQKNELLHYQAGYRDRSIYQKAELRRKLIEQRRKTEEKEKQETVKSPAKQINAMDAAFEGGSGKSGSGSANFSSTGGGAG